jgi:multiple antibiotic resistance protein
MIDFAIYSFVVLFIIIDPIANMPIFSSILEKFNPKYRKPMIKKAVGIAAGTLVLFMLVGNHVFNVLGIKMYSFKIAGGVLLFIIALEMLFGRRTRTESSSEEEDEAKIRNDIVATPLAVPLLTGPGAITAGIVLMNSASSSMEKIFLFISVFLVFFASYVILSESDRLLKILGSTGTRVIVRIMGLLLSAIAVQFVLDGISEAIEGVKG